MDDQTTDRGRHVSGRTSKYLGASLAPVPPTLETAEVGNIIHGQEVPRKEEEGRTAED